MISLKRFNVLGVLQAFAGIASAILIAIILTLTLKSALNSLVGVVISLLISIIGGYSLRKDTTTYLESLFLGLLLVGEFAFIGILTFEIFKYRSDSYFLYLLTLAIFALSYYFVKLPIYRLFASFVIYVSLYNLSLIFGILPLYSFFIVITIAYLLVKRERFIELKYAWLLAFLFTPNRGYSFSYAMDKFLTNESIFSPYGYILYIFSTLIAYIIVLREFEFKLNELLSWLLFASIAIIAYFEPFHLMMPLLVLLIGFYQQNWSLKIISILSFVYSIYIYNYSIEITFLEKSKDLAIFGIVLIVIASLLNIYKKRLQNV